jgi:hypothetical protein
MPYPYGPELSQHDQSLEDEFNSDQWTALTESKSRLQAAVRWIGDNLNPEDVFSEHDLRQWMEKLRFVKGPAETGDQQKGE